MGRYEAGDPLVRTLHPGAAMMARPELLLALGCCLTLALAAGWARADEFDTVNFNAGTTFLHDTNLFRLPAGADPNVVLRAPTGADTLNVNSVGVKLSKPYSLQRFELGVDFVDYRYKTFTFLNFSAFNYDAAWRWSVTPRLHGNLTADRTETLNTFADFRSFVRNVRTVQNQRFDGEYEVDGVWRLLGGVSQVEAKNEQVFLAQQDYRQRNAEGGIKHVFGSGSSMSAVARVGSGEFTKLAGPINASLFDNRFDQREVETRFFWAVSGKSTFDGRLSYLERRHQNFSQRNFSGLAGNASVSWGISGKSRLVASVSRDLASFIQASSSYTRLDKWSLGPVWSVSSKAVMRARYEQSTRAFLGPVAVTPQNDRQDKLRTLYVGADWQPRRWVTLSASLQKDRKSVV